MRDSSADFQMRLWLFDDESLELKVWCYEFDPMTSTSRHAEEWVEEHLYGLANDGLRALFELPPKGNFQVLANGSIHGWFDYWGEYDEEVTIRECESKEVLAEYMEAINRQAGGDDEG